jgi:hypothetical protein
MPIHLNLLAEAQTAEEMRRRDPVKRAMWICGFLVALVLGYSSYLQWKIMQSNRVVAHIEAGLATQTNRFTQIIENSKKLTDVNYKLGKLNELATNRFLWGNVLNALQQTTVEDIQLLRLKSEQNYDFQAEVKSKKDDSGKLVPGKPALVTEKITLMFDAKDGSVNPGAMQMNLFKEGLQTNSFFKMVLGKTNQIRLKNYAQPQLDPELGRPCVLFSLECALPEKVYR